MGKVKVPDELNQLYNLSKEIEVKIALLEGCREISQNPVSRPTDYNSGGVQYSLRVEKSASWLIEIEKSLIAKIEKLNNLKAEALSSIDNMKDIRYQELLIYRYIYGYKWEVVAEKMKYSYVHVVHRLHKKAINDFINSQNLSKSTHSKRVLEQ